MSQQKNHGTRWYGEVQEELSQNRQRDSSNKSSTEGGNNCFSSECKEEEQQQQTKERGKDQVVRDSSTMREEEVIKERVEEEEQNAYIAHAKALRDANTVTDEMREEVMGLLELLGVPYMVAPMEAEAQCVELERLNLIDGTITDDSDVLIFGSCIAYKNIFEDVRQHPCTTTTTTTAAAVFGNLLIIICNLITTSMSSLLIVVTHGLMLS